MRKMYYLMLMLFIISIASVNAQVTIGSQSDPHDGAILDLSKASVQDKGLLLPSVTLTSVTVWDPVGGTAVAGMMVYNKNTSTANGLSGTGVYVWSENKWNKVSGNVSTELAGSPEEWVSTTASGLGTSTDPYTNVCPSMNINVEAKTGFMLSNITGGTIANNIATFTSSGQVIAGKDGKTGTIYVTINSCAVTGVTLSPTTMNLVKGGLTGNLTATVSPGNAANKTVTWNSSNTSVATVSDGLVTPLTAGSTTITVKTNDGNKTATALVTVIAPPVNTFAIPNGVFKQNTEEYIGYLDPNGVAGVLSHFTATGKTLYVANNDEPSRITWDVANSTCKNKGMRLPTFGELANMQNISNKPPLTYYWSFSEQSADRAWHWNFQTLLGFDTWKTDTRYVRCVWSNE